MEEKSMINELINTLEEKGEISINDGTEEFFIQNVDDKEGYSYVSSTNEEFESSRAAVNWAIEKVNGIDNIVTWK